MSKARELADLITDGIVRTDVTAVPNALPVTNFIYGTEATPANLPDGCMYVQVDTGTP